MTAKWKSVAALVAVFVLGAAAGGGAVYAQSQKRHAAMLRDGRDVEGRRLAALSRKLDLDGDQKTKIGAILSQDHDDTKALNRDMMEKCGQPLRDHRADVEAQIRAVLRPDQQKKFDHIIEERKDRGLGGPPR